MRIIQMSDGTGTLYASENYYFVISSIGRPTFGKDSFKLGYNIEEYYKHATEFRYEDSTDQTKRFIHE